MKGGRGDFEQTTGRSKCWIFNDFGYW